MHGEPLQTLQTYSAWISDSIYIKMHTFLQAKKLHGRACMASYVLGLGVRHMMLITFPTVTSMIGITIRAG